MKKVILLVLLTLCILGCYSDDLVVSSESKNEKSKLSKGTIENGIDYGWSGIDFPKPNFLLQQRPDILWGINGHPISWVNQYDQFSNEDQIELLNNLGVSIYRFEGNVDEYGKLISTSSSR